MSLPPVSMITSMWTTEPQDMYLVSSLPLLFLPPSSYQFYPVITICFYLFSPCFWFLLLIHFCQHFIIHVLTVKMTQIFSETRQKHMKKKKWVVNTENLNHCRHTTQVHYTHTNCVPMSVILVYCFQPFSVFTFLLNPPIK